jgi:hypothetical protein
MIVIHIVCHPALHFQWFKEHWRGDDFTHAQEVFDLVHAEYLSKLPAPAPPVVLSAPPQASNDLFARLASYARPTPDSTVLDKGPEPACYEVAPHLPDPVQNPLAWWKVCLSFIM